MATDRAEDVRRLKRLDDALDRLDYLLDLSDERLKEAISKGLIKDEVEINYVNIASNAAYADFEVLVDDLRKMDQKDINKVSDITSRMISIAEFCFSAGEQSLAVTRHQNKIRRRSMLLQARTMREKRWRKEKDVERFEALDRIISSKIFKSDRELKSANKIAEGYWEEISKAMSDEGHGGVSRSTVYRRLRSAGA